MVIGVGNSPVLVKGLLQSKNLEWAGIMGKVSLIVLDTLQDIDVILGMDVLSDLKVEVKTWEGQASPCVDVGKGMGPVNVNMQKG